MFPFSFKSFLYYLCGCATTSSLLILGSLICCSSLYKEQEFLK